ncbi:MAG: hypothetical protein ACR2I2_23715 [Bryobacteraceae bacterium]
MTTTGPIWADDDTRIFPPDSRPASLAPTQAEWSARWWQWAFTTNDNVDLTGANCGVGQSGQVFFLAGAPVTTAVNRSCTVPANKILFFPLINSECSNVEPPPFHGNNEAQLRACAKAAMDGVNLSTLRLTIDGVPIGHLGSLRTQSPLYAVTVGGTCNYDPNFCPNGNQLGVPPGTSLFSVSDGFWVMMQLSSGMHVIHFEAAVVSGPGAGFSQNITYHLRISGE